MIQIDDTRLNFEREPLLKPFGFKGGFLSSIWQSVVGITSTSGHTGVGLGTQSVLWSDAQVFVQHSEQGGNALMLTLTEFALGYLKGRRFTHPMDLTDELVDAVLEYGRTVTRHNTLRTTFALNALVAVDFALWQLYAHTHQKFTLDTLIPDTYLPPLGHRNDKLASIPLVSYNTSSDTLEHLLKQGYFVLKVKLGSPGTQGEMVQQDKDRLSFLHSRLKHHKTPHTPDGHIPYYLDANGRYESKEALLRVLDHADHIGALERIVILEEPFPESLDIGVEDLPVCIAADESAHTDHDTLQRIQMGYSAVALKPVAKTLSMTLRIAKTAHEHSIPCFCADLTVNPLLVEWNKAIAARIAPFPGVNLPLMETNGHQNYQNWDHMCTYLPDPQATWLSSNQGVFLLSDAFYSNNNNILAHPPHYTHLIT